jgi:hypothetical protein
VLNTQKFAVDMKRSHLITLGETALIHGIFCQYGFLSLEQSQQT